MGGGWWWWYDLNHQNKSHSNLSFSFEFEFDVEFPFEFEWTLPISIPENIRALLGPHPVGSFEVWTPREFLADLMTFMMYHRGELSVLVHPLGKTEVRDHSSDAMWLGPSFPLDISSLSPTGGDPPQYPELGLGYSNHN